MLRQTAGVMITFDLSLVQLLSSKEGGKNTFLIWFNSNLSLNLVITETGKGCIWLEISKNLIVLQKKKKMSSRKPKSPQNNSNMTSIRFS